MAEQIGVDTSKVTGWDAIAFKTTTGHDLEAWLGIPATVPLATRALAMWLHVRQADQPDVSLQAVASLLTLTPPDEVASSGAPGDG